MCLADISSAAKVCAADTCFALVRCWVFAAFDLTRAYWPGQLSTLDWAGANLEIDGIFSPHRWWWMQVTPILNISQNWIWPGSLTLAWIESRTSFCTVIFYHRALATLRVKNAMVTASALLFNAWVLRKVNARVRIHWSKVSDVSDLARAFAYLLSWSGIHNISKIEIYIFDY